MRATFRRVGLISCVTSALVVAAVQPAFGAPPPPTAVVDSAPEWTAQAPVVGDVPADQTQHLTVALNLRDEAGAETLAAAVADPANAQYGKYISATDWRARFAPGDDTVNQVTSWLSSQGFAIGDIPANHRYIPFTGSTAQVQAAFGTSVKTFDRDGVTASAPASPLTAPTSVAALIAGVGGLDSSATVRPDHLTGDDTADGRSTGAAGSRSAAPRSVSPQAAVPGDALPPPDAVYRNATPCSTYYGQKKATGVPQILPDPLTYAPCGYKPEQLRGAYDIDRFLSKGIDGRGATVAVVDAYASATILADTQKYFARNDPSHPFRAYQFSQSLPASYNSIDDCNAAGWYGEETLDVEAVHAMAPGANVLYVGASSCQDDDILAAVNTVVDNQLAQVITNSYGDVGEPSRAAAEGDHQTYLQAAAEGISVLFSSGDAGDEIAATGTRQADYPASDPAVTAVGGTSLAVGASNNYLFEQGWGTGTATLSNGAWDPNPPEYLYGAGGGTSRLFKQPAYQRGVVPADIANWVPAGATPNGPHRAVPDVAMDADPQTGMLIGQSQTFPDGSVKYSEYRIGGTSLASPLFAGVVAVGNQATGGSLGFLNPRLYRKASASLLRDVTTACPATPQQCVTDGVVRVNYVNGFDASAGKATILRTFNQTGSIYTRPGYDDVTGVGSPDIAGMLGGSSGGGGNPAAANSPAGPVHGQPMR
ncbi:protease pro-enzyme activation domain-containing protein [Nakamurella sp.]|uniref:S53 family peptidase n=1 Tax=Nakamurella sp. TaxID=1869182 RepID=UPI003784AF23